MPRKPMPDVIILLPGITGSVLQKKDGKDSWTLSAEAGSEPCGPSARASRTSSSKTIRLTLMTSGTVCA